MLSSFLHEGRFIKNNGKKLNSISNSLINSSLGLTLF